MVAVATAVVAVSTAVLAVCTAVDAVAACAVSVATAVATCVTVVIGVAESVLEAAITVSAAAATTGTAAVTAACATTTSGVYSTGTVFGGGKYGASILNGYIDNIRVSNVNRYSGASYTVATTGFTLDSNTYLLIPPVESNGATSIAFQSTGGNGTMTNATNLVTVSSSRANHT